MLSFTPALPYDVQKEINQAYGKWFLEHHPMINPEDCNTPSRPVWETVLERSKQAAQALDNVHGRDAMDDWMKQYGKFY